MKPTQHDRVEIRAKWLDDLADMAGPTLPDQPNLFP